MPGLGLKTILRWSYAALLLIGLGSLSCYGIVKLQSSLYRVSTDEMLKPAEIARPVLAPAAPPRVVEAGSIGRIEIPTIGFSAPILEGVSPRSLRLGIGHIPDTAMPGERGNAALAGHRDTFFRPLEKIRAGHEIVVTTLRGLARYRVHRLEVVNPADVHVLHPTVESKLTLITCYPFRFVGAAPKRFVVHAYQSRGAASVRMIPSRDGVPSVAP